jgi:hypothetical protein
MTAIDVQSRSRRARSLPQTGQRPAAENAGAVLSRAVPPMVSERIELRIGAARPSRFHVELARRVAAVAPSCTITKVDETVALPASVELLLDLERLVYRLRPGLSAKDDSAERDVQAPGSIKPGIVIDLTAGTTWTSEVFRLRVLYDGEPGDVGVLGALIQGRVPLIQIVDGSTGAVLTEGRPATDNAGTISEAFDFVLARTITLILAALNGSRHQAESFPRKAVPPDVKRFVTVEARSLATAAVRRLYHLCCFAPHWRVMWRRIERNDVWDTGSLLGPKWNVVPDPGFRFFADPFPYVHEGRTHIFVEDLDHRTNKGIISVLRLDDTGAAGEARPVLEEPWHLSYPFLIEAEGQIWMIPESSAGRRIALYRADPYPDRWVRECVLIDDIEASDATVVEHDGRYWMFAATRDGQGSWSDTLSIFMASSIRGPWRPHPGNPVLVSQSGARPAGGIQKRSGALLRPVQDCALGYGTGIGLARIDCLNEESFAQHVTSVLRPLPEWPGKRLHTLNRAGAIECIDGAAHSPRHRGLARMLEGWSGRAEVSRASIE